MRGFQPAGNKTLKKNSVGPVRGPGTGTSDDVQTRVQDGTYIMPTDSTDAIGEQNLAAMGKGSPVDVNLSNGEFKMPPEQVHAIGVQALDQMKDATHTPLAARGLPAPTHQPGEPPLFFFDGGGVDKENAKRFAQVPAALANRGNNTFGSAEPSPQPQQSAAMATASAATPTAGASPNQTSPVNIFPQSSPSAGANVYSGAGFSADQYGSSGKLALVPSSIGQQPGRTLAPAPVPTQEPTVVAATATPGAAPVAPVAAPARQSEMLASQLQGLPAPQFQRDVAQREQLSKRIHSAQASERYDAAGAQMAAEARAAATMRMNRAAQRPLASAALPASAGEAALAAHDAGSTVGAGRGFINPASVAPTPISPAAGGPISSLAPVATAGAGRGETNPPTTDPSALAPTSVTSGPTEVAPGVFRSGNSYSDSAAGAVAGAQTRGLPVPQASGPTSPVGMSPEQAQRAGLIGERIGYNPAYDRRLMGEAGQPTPQNLAAADALAKQSQQASTARVMAGQPTERGWSGVIGTDPAAGRERKAMLDSLTTVMPGARGITAAQRSNLQTVLNREMASVNAANSNSTALQQTAMQTGTQRDMAAMREAGDNGRAVLRESGETGRAGARNALDRGRLGLEQQVRGFDIRSGERQEKLHQRYEAAKTPEQKSAIAQQIRDLSGKADPTNRFTVVTGGQEWDATAGAMRNVPGRVLNNQTGQFVEQGGAAPKSGPITPNSKAEYDALPKGAQYIKDGKVLVKN